jgi:6-phosphofructokinase 1
MLDPTTGRTRVRRVDVTSNRFKIARDYMIRLRKTDFANAEAVKKMAGVVKVSSDDFRKQFEHTVAHE